MTDDARADLIASMVEASGRVRHPSLPLDHFLHVDYYDLIDDDQDDPLANIPAAEIETAHARRGSVMLAAEQIVDKCIDDLQQIDFDDDGMPEPDMAEDSFVYEAFPRRHRRAYNEYFFRKILVSAVKVAYDLADPQGLPAACTAEEIIRQALGHGATSLCELVDLDDPRIDLDDALLEDVDFENLFDDDMDGIEDDPARQAAMGIEVPDVDNWFSPFNDTYVVHPYAETEPTESPAVHDLFDRVDDSETHSAILKSNAIDSADPITSFRAASDVVALARRAADDADPALWIPDEADPEGSFAALFTAAQSAEYGSGWMTWEPYQHADIVRTDPVVSLTPHRHFPVGDDQPWVWAAVGGGRLLAVPLDVVVSYLPDSDVRQRWNNAFSFLATDENE